MTKEEIGAVLKRLRTESGMTQAEIAGKIGRTQQIVGHWETGYAQPDANTLFTLCGYYGTTVDEAFGFKKKNDVSRDEYEIIEKYRVIKKESPDGLKVVDAVLNREYAVTIKMQEQADKIKKLETEISEEFIPRRIFAYYGKIAAAGTSYGFGDVIAGTKEYPLNEVNESADYTIGVSGDSMEPAFYDGNIVYVKKVDYRLKIGDVGIFQKDNGIYIKRVAENGLVSDNENYKPMVNGGDVICLGKVLGKAE